jgi:hypothetical protein
MEDSLAFDPNRAAVLSMDMQTGIVAIYAKDESGKRSGVFQVGKTDSIASRLGT